MTPADQPSLSLTFLGTGTSQGIPVIGCRCATCLSNDPRDKRLRVAALLSNGNTNVLIDCGPDVRQQLLRAGVTTIDALLLTHEHNDHIIGLDDLRPLIFARRRPFVVYAEGRVLAEIQQRFAYAFAADPYPGAPSFELHDISPGHELHIGDLPPIEPLRVEHGRLPILGYRCGKLAYLTDVKRVPAATQERLAGLDVLVTSALHDYDHHSHMSLEQAQAFAKTVDAATTYFLHMSHFAGPHRELAARLSPKQQLAYDNLRLTIAG